MQPLGALIVDDLVGLDGRAGIVDLDVADSRDELIVVIVLNLVGLDEHLLVAVLRLQRRVVAGIGSKLGLEGEIGLRARAVRDDEQHAGRKRNGRQRRGANAATQHRRPRITRRLHQQSLPPNTPATPYRPCVARTKRATT